MNKVLWIFLITAIAWVQGLQAQMQWYRGNVHAHTTNSDGDDSVDTVINDYKGRGYNFLVITDHDTITRVEDRSTSSFLLINGEEVSGERHYGAVGLSDFVDKTGKSDQVQIDEILWRGAIPIINHPIWDQTFYTLQDVLKLKNVNHIEIYNYITESWGFRDNQALWDGILSSGRKMYGVAADDSHKGRQVGRAWLMVRASKLGKAEILNAMREGQYYCSTGPRFEEILRQDQLLSIRTDVDCEIKFIGLNGQVLQKTNGRTASYSLKGSEGYVRAEIKDALAQRAWTQPLIFFEQGSAQPTLALQSGDGQSGAVQATLANPLVVKCVDSSGLPRSGVDVVFAAVAGVGLFSGKTSLQLKTDSGGLASALPTLGTVASATPVVFKSYISGGADTVTFRATVLAGPAAQIVQISGNGQSGLVNQTLVSPLKVKIVDAFNNPVAKESVLFKVKTGGGRVYDPASVPSGADGASQAVWVLGPTAGQQELEVSVQSGAAAVIFRATAADPTPGSLVLVSGDQQAGKLNLTLKDSLLVRVLDGAGKPLSRIPVMFTLEKGYGVFIGDNPDTSNALGVAGVRFRPIGQISDILIRAGTAGLEQTVAFQCHVAADTLITPLILSEFSRPAYGVDFAVPQSQCYLDRDYFITKMPDYPANSYIVRTANNDKSATDPAFFSFTINHPVMMYIAYDSRISGVPEWLRGFEKTDQTITVSDNTQMNLWKAFFLPGRVTLGGNAATGFQTSKSYSMYFILLHAEYIPSSDQTSPAPPGGLLAMPLL